jgi:hypothetical protein
MLLLASKFQLVPTALNFNPSYNFRHMIPANLFQQSIGEAGSGDGYYSVVRSQQFLTPP